MARDPYRYFRVEARDLADQLGRSVLELERAGSGGEVVPRLLRLAHTLKGAARVVRLPAIAEHAHSIEDVLTPFRDGAGPVSHESIDALLGLLDRIASSIGELVPPAEEGTSSGPGVADMAMPLRAETSDLDRLLRSVAAANAQLSGFTVVAEAAFEARRLTGQLLDQLGDTATEHASNQLIAASAQQLSTLAAGIERTAAATHERVDRELTELREAAEQLRLVPADGMFATLERAARDTAQLLGKEIDFDAQRSEIRLDGQSLKIIQNAVLQLVRNAVAHGVETRRDRVAAGKPARGVVRISVSRRSRRIVFRCEDDGRGIDIAALRQAAERKGRPVATDADGHLGALLLQGGVSTSLFVSEAAGRGIGMDIVRETVARLNAQFSVGTEAGKGTWFELAVPLSLSSVDCLLLEAHGARTSIALASVRTTRWLGPADVHRTTGGDAIIEDGDSLRLIPLSTLLRAEVPGPVVGGRSAVIVQSASGLAAIRVDRIVGTATIVFQPLPELAPSSGAIEGASFGADGIPLLMLNAEGVVAAAGRHRPATRSTTPPRRPLLVVDDSLTTRMLEQSILESAGYQVDTAVSAEEALERVRTRDYGLILVDVEMPGMDGFGFVTELRRDPRTRSIPAILVTSRNADADKRRGAEVGAQGYMVKSEFDQAALLGRVHQLVS